MNKNIISQEKNWKEVDLRDAFFDELYEIIKIDKNVILLTIDMGAMSMNKIVNDFPNQYINVGIAEQNAISLASGLALSGRKVFVYGITSFTILRCLEQIKIDVCYMNLPISIIGIGTGFTYGTDGPTHYVLEDISIMRTMPNIEIYSPSDVISTAMSAKFAYNSKSPTYVRIEKGISEQIYHPDFNYESGIFLIKKGRTIIVSTGRMTHQSIKLAKRLEEIIKQEVGVIDIFKIKPFNYHTFFHMIDMSDCIITLEEHLLEGGIGSIIAEFIIDYDIDITLKRYGVPNKSFSDFKGRDHMLSICNLTNDKIIEDLME